MYHYNIAFLSDFITSLMSNIKGKEKEKIIYNNSN